jgi:hypothetical protein
MEEIMTPDETKMIAGAVFGLTMLLVWIPLFIGLAVGIGFIAARLRKNVALWVILTLIPGYNVFFIYYVWFYVVCRMLNRLNQIADKVGVAPEPAA